MHEQSTCTVGNSDSGHVLVAAPCQVLISDCQNQLPRSSSSRPPSSHLQPGGLVVGGKLRTPVMAEPSFSVGAFAMLPTSSASVECAAASSKFVLLGLSTGTLALYDVFGNLLDSHESLHVGPVAAVALSDEVIASAGSARNDIRAARLFAGAAVGPSGGGDAVRTGMITKATVAVVKHADEQVVALAVDPNFGKPRFGDRVAYVDRRGRVAVYTAGWFGGSDVLVAEPTDVQVTDLKWVQYLLAVAYKDVVKVFDTRANRPVCVVAPPGSTAPQSPMPSPRREGAFLTKEADGDGAAEGGHVDGDVGAAAGSPEKDGDTLVEGAETGSEDDSVSGSSWRRRDDTWALKTKIYMEVDDAVPLSLHGEATVSLYVTWPSGARIVQIGPLKDVAPSEQTSQREIDVAFKLERHDLFLSETRSADEEAMGDIVGTFDEAPLLSLVPFGEKETVALVGTPSRGLTMHLISPDTGKSVKNMQMPYNGLRDADLLTVPGGDPLVLILGHWPTASSKMDGVSDETHKSDGVIYVRSLTTAERVKWLLGQGRFSDALHIAQSAPGGSLRRAEVSLEDIGEQFLDSLREAGDYEKLASVLPETITTTTPYVGFRAREKVMAKRIKRWERWMDTFRNAGNLAMVAPVVPTYEPCLPEGSYNGIIVELAASDPNVMLDVLKTWPADVFGVSAVTKAIEGRLAITGDKKQSAHEREPLREGLLMMYGLSGRHDETLNLLLREQSPKVYDYIRSHHLYEAVRSPETITGLYNIDPDAATEILSHAPETVLPPEAVVPILVKIDNSLWTFMYLHAVFRADVDQAPKYHNQLLKLYVDHGNPGMLFNFLRTSTHYSLDRALREMGGPKGFKSGHLASERVYVLSAMGDLNSAMDILLDELGDTFAAIEFASDHGDTVLWERLIDHARTHAETLAALLDSPAGGKVDPVRLVPLLTSEMRILHLRDRLHRILVDAALERALREDAAAALHHDASELLRDLDECVSILR